MYISIYFITRQSADSEINKTFLVETKRLSFVSAAFNLIRSPPVIYLLLLVSTFYLYLEVSSCSLSG